MQITDRWLQSLGLERAQIDQATQALSDTDLTMMVEAARSPFLGELVATDAGDQPSTPRPISPVLAASGCVFSLRMNTGTYPRDHHWLTHLGWMVALNAQPDSDRHMPADAVDLRETLTEHHDNLAAEMRRIPTSTLGVMLYRTMHQLNLFHPGNDAEYWLFTRIAQSVLCEVINNRAEGSPLTQGGYDDAATAMVRQAVIDAGDDEAAFDLADRAQMPEAYEARRRALRERAPF